METKEKLGGEYFTEDSMTDMTHEEFQGAAAGLIAKGLMEMVERDGVKYYRLSPLCMEMKDHFTSEPKDRN